MKGLEPLTLRLFKHDSRCSTPELHPLQAVRVLLSLPLADYRQNQVPVFTRLVYRQPTCFMAAIWLLRCTVSLKAWWALWFCTMSLYFRRAIYMI